MKIKVKISFKEYLKLLFALTYRRPILIVIVVVDLLLIAWIAFYYLKIFDLPKPTYYQFATIFLITIIQPLLIFITIRANYKSSNHLAERVEIELGEEHIKIHGESFYTEILCKKLFKIDEHRNWFLIYQNNLSAIVIPKWKMKKSEIIKARIIFNDIKNVRVNLLKEKPSETDK